MSNFFISYETIDVNDIAGTHKHLMKKHDIVQIPGFIKRTFIVNVLVLGFGISLAIICMSINNQHCMVRSMIIHLNPGELGCYLFIVSMDWFDGSCNNFDDSFGRICVPNKTEDVNLKAFNMIKGINECRCKFSATNSRQKWNNGKCQCDCKIPIRHRAADSPAILVNVPASVIMIVRLANTCKILKV